MLKKTLLSNTILALTTSIAFAGTMGAAAVPEAYTYKAGPYIGFSVGPRIMLLGNPIQYVGAEGTLSVGYGHLWNQWFYLAGEIFGGTSVRMKSIGVQPIKNATLSNIRTTWSYGFDVLPGIMINKNTIGYLRGGVVNTQFKLQTNQYGVLKHEPTGWRAGVGMQTNVYKNLDVRFDYIYNQFSRQVKPANWGRPSNSLVDLGIVYRFV